MKIYFEDGYLKLIHGIPGIDSSKSYKLHKCDASEGTSFCNVILGHAVSNYPSQAMYTNALCALQSEYSWNPETKKHDLFFRDESGEWVSAESLLKGCHKYIKLEENSNLITMYLRGYFRKAPSEDHE